MGADSASARVSALVALGKSIAMFSDKVIQEDQEPRSASDIEADLQRRLAALVGE